MARDGLSSAPHKEEDAYSSGVTDDIKKNHGRLASLYRMDNPVSVSIREIAACGGSKNQSHHYIGTTRYADNCMKFLKAGMNIWEGVDSNGEIEVFASEILDYFPNV